MTPFCELTSGASSDSSMRPTVARSRWPCSMLVNRARLVFSQSCSVFWSVVSRRLSIIVLMLSLSSATSPRASTWIDRVRSPLVTAVATSAIARTWVVRLAARRLTLPVRSFQVPAAPGTFACPPRRPSTPTSRATRNGRLTAELTFGADLARDARHLGRKGVQLIDHRVDRVLQLEDLALHVDRDLARQVAARDRSRDLRDIAHLRRQVRRQQVDVVGQILPRTGHPGNDGLTSQLAFGADLTGDARHLGGERAQLLDHRVEGFFEQQDLAAHIDRDFFGQVAMRCGGGDLGDIAHLA